MGNGYTRNDTANNIADGNVINASDLDGEFDKLQTAFDGTSGHSHDGTSGEGPQIAAGGLANNAVTTDKIANDAVILGTKTSGNYVAAGATSGTGISGSVSSEGGTFTVTSNATNANTASTIVARDGSGNFSAGTITASLTGTASNANQLDSLDSTQFLRSDAADTKTSGDLSFSDNVKAQFGTGSDLQIYHDGTNSFIKDNGDGGIFMRATSNIKMESTDGNRVLAEFIDSAGVDLYYNNGKKLATTSGGVTVTGTASATTFSGDLNGTINTNTTATTQSAGNNTTKVATTAFVTTAVNNAEPFPSGTSMLFQQTAAPTGWTKQTSHNNKAIRLTTGTVGTGGSSPFTTAFGTPSVAGGAISGNPTNNHSVSAGNLSVSSGNLAATAGNLSVSMSGNISSTTLTINQIPAHKHGTYSPGGNNPQTTYFSKGNGYTNAPNGSTSGMVNAGNGGSHNHGHNLSGSMSGSPGLTGNPTLSGSPTLSGDVNAGNLAVGASTASINVQYVDFIIANKD